MDSKDIKFSLVIGTYNPNMEWLNNALASAEGLFDEIIIVDDGSDVPVPCATVSHETNMGFWHARNTGCKLAKGKWIISLDDDDEFVRDNVIKLKQVIDSFNADIIASPIVLFGNQNGHWGVNPDMNNILNFNQIPSGSWFKKSVFEKLKGFQLAEGEDWDFWARAHKHGFKFKYYPEIIYRHRMRVGSMSEHWIGEKFVEIRNNVRKNYEKEQI